MLDHLILKKKIASGWKSNIFKSSCHKIIHVQHVYLRSTFLVYDDARTILCMSLILKDIF